MLTFDFAKYVNKYKHGRWKICRIGRRMCHTFAQHFVLHAEEKDFQTVALKARRLRKLWGIRLKELATKQLWFPNTRLLNPYDTSFNLKKFELTFRRMLFCRPTFFYYKWKRDKVYRPCNRAHFCPFCAARIAAAQYRYVKMRVRRFGVCNPETKLVVTVRVLQQFVPAKGFDPLHGCDEDVIPGYMRKLRAVLETHRNAYKACAKRLQRNTMGSMWRMVVIPQDKGWLVESRQCMIRYPHKRIPAVQVRDAKVTLLESINISECYDKQDTRFFDILGAFSSYPEELLTGYAELVAVYLRTVHKVRLSAGTGLLRKTSRSIIAFFQKVDADARVQKANAAAANADVQAQPEKISAQ